MIQQLIRYGSTQDTAAHLRLVKTQHLILDYLWQRLARHYPGHSGSFYRYYLAGWVGQWYLTLAWNSRAKGPKLWILKDNLESHGANHLTEMGFQYFTSDIWDNSLQQTVSMMALDLGTVGSIRFLCLVVLTQATHNQGQFCESTK